MWKDWFYYTRSERCVIVLLLAVFAVLSYLVSVENGSAGTFNLDDDSVALADSLSRKIRESKKRYKPDSSYALKPARSSIHANREKTGTDSFQEKTVYRPFFRKREKFTRGTLVDVNTADTALLKKIPGIGSVISRNIVRYRESLGGFYDLSQLLEVRYVDSVHLEWFKLETGIYRKLKVNSDDIHILKRHPYMGYYKAKSVIDYRKRRGRIENALQLSFLNEFTDDDLDRLTPYLDFR